MKLHTLLRTRLADTPLPAGATARHYGGPATGNGRLRYGEPIPLIGHGDIDVAGLTPRQVDAMPRPGGMEAGGFTLVAWDRDLWPADGRDW